MLATSTKNTVTLQDIQQLLTMVNAAAYDYKSGRTENQCIYNQAIRELKSAYQQYNTNAGYCRKIKLEADKILLTSTSKYIHDAVKTYRITPDKEANMIRLIRDVVDDANSIAHSKIPDFNEYNSVLREAEAMLIVFNTFASSQYELIKENGLYSLVPEVW